jgi:exonuclease VII small subunit
LRRSSRRTLLGVHEPTPQHDLALEESLRLFEEGVQLSRASQQRLDAAEKRVDELLTIDESGQAITAPFSTDAESEDAGEARRPQRPMAPR